MEPKQSSLGLDGPEAADDPLFPDEAPERAQESPKPGEFVNAHGVCVTDDDIPF